jgi:starch synthase (maltosyl-transferring)
LDHLTTPLIYNLFPRLVGSIDQWPNHAARAAALGFNWLYLNPFHLPGLSGSLYAIKDYDRLHPAFLPDRGEEGELHGLRPVLRDIASFGIHPMVDLVINHTAIDAPLVQAHPEWYIRNEKGIIQSPYAVDPTHSEGPVILRGWQFNEGSSSS